MRQIKIRKMSGQVEVITGLHIGGSTDSLEIGGMDNPIIRYPHNKEPYIPGSSLKGKMRSLSEWHFDKVKDGKVHVCSDDNCEICRVFGSTKESENRGPTRLIVRDCSLSEKSKNEFIEGLSVIEEKHENSINRVTSVANPRPIERVVPGVVFDFEMVYRIFDTGDGGKTDKENFEKVLLNSLKLVEQNFLGGGGSRGSGRVKFINIKEDEGKELSP